MLFQPTTPKPAPELATRLPAGASDTHGCARCLAPLIAATLLLMTLGMRPAAAISVTPGQTASLPARPALLQTPGTPIVISPLCLPNGLVETPYRQSLTASGGTAPYSFAVADGALPDGLNLSADGVLSGTPAAVGSFNFFLSTTDARGASTNVFYQLNILTPIALSPPVLLEGKVGSAYRQIFGASGGSFPYSFTVTDGALPSGLELANSGELSGTPTIVGVYSFTVTVSDGGGRTAAQQLTIVID
jgi:putative Ig domain-containing protein